MSWELDSTSRERFPVASSHHQTLLGKALYEYGNCQRVAAVALSSSSIQNSSLGPNLLSLLQVEDRTIQLFTSAFSCDSANTTLQFTKKLFLYSQDENCVTRYGKFLSSLINNNKCFQKSLRELEVELGHTYRSRTDFWKFVLTASPSASWKFTALNKLTVRFCVSEELLQNLARFPALEELTLVRFGEKLSSFDNLSKLTKLTSLDLSYCDNTTDAVLAAAAKCVNLTSLDLSWCQNITDVGVQAISGSCINLTKLSLHGCNEITSVGLEAISNLDKLTSLDLYKCPKITDVGLKSIADYCVNLTSLNLTFCKNITAVGKANAQKALPYVEIAD